MRRLRSLLTATAAPAVLALSLSLTLAGCATAPATGKQIFTGGLTLQDEKRIGAEEHAKILETFGDAYDDPAVTSYVNRIGQALARHAELPDIGYTFTVLNSDQVNAFALPGGYVYVTRGLMALAGDEAELAGVIAHEIGHVNARHSAERMGKGLLANILGAGVGIVAGSGVANQVFGVGAIYVLQSYSRDQEFEADTLGVRYLKRAGYDGQAMASFLGRMRAHGELQAKLAGKDPSVVDKVDLLATHPRPADRVQAAITAANTAGTTESARNRVEYMSVLDGMLFGDDPKEGFVRGRTFIHPTLLFRFEVPEGFRLYNGRKAVTAQGPGESAIRFDMVGGNYTGSMTRYLTNIWGKDLRLDGVERIVVNGMASATGATRIRQQSGAMDLRLVAIRQNPDRIYRFMFLTPTGLTSRLSEGLRRTTFSMKPIAAEDAGSVKPLRIRIRAVKQGDSALNFIQQMAFDDLREERFRVYNGLAPNEGLRPGRLVKIITE